MENEKFFAPEEEKWVVCKDYPAYEVSNYGQVRNIKSQKILSGKLMVSGGYYQVHLRSGVQSKNGKYITIHRLVAQAFCENDNPEKKYMVDHIDRNKTNNYYKNLRWVTPSENKKNSGITENRKRIAKKKTPIVLVDKNNLQFIEEFSSPYEAHMKLKINVNNIINSIRQDKVFFKIGKFMTKDEYLNLALDEDRA